MFSWYFEHEYNGEKVQVLPNKAEPSGDGYGNTPRTFAGAVYYRADQGESFAEALEKIQEAICGVYTAEENRARNGYIMTDYRIYPPDSYPNQKDDDENLAEAGQDVWTVRNLYIYYKYEGKCFGGTFEQQKEGAGPLWTDENGLILAFGDGSENVNLKVIVKQGDVYMLAAPAYFARHREHKPDLGESAFIKKLRETNPEVFSLDTSHGLIIAADKWVEPEHYRYYLISGGRPYIKLSETAGRWFTEDEIEEILDTYGLPDDQISVRYFQHPNARVVYSAGNEQEVLRQISGLYDGRFRAGLLSVWYDAPEIAAHEDYDPFAVQIDLNFGQVQEKGQAVSDAEQNRIAAFLTEGKNSEVLGAWDFILQSFRDPSGIDVGTLSYSKGTERDASGEEEAAAFAEAGYTPWTDASKRTYSGMNDLFVKYTGQELSADQRRDFFQWVYVPEYDAYYSFASDMPYDIPVTELGRACRLDTAAAKALGIDVEADEIIAVEWKTPEWDGNSGMAILIPDGDTYKIAANFMFK